MDAHAPPGIFKAGVQVPVQVVKPACAGLRIDLKSFNISLMSYFFSETLLRDTDLTLAHASKSRLGWKLGETVLGIGSCKSQSSEESEEHHVEESGKNSTDKQKCQTTFYTVK